MKVLFWNTHKNTNINPTIGELIAENNASIVVLAEYTANSDDLLSSLRLQYGITMQRYNSCCERITIIGTVSNVEMRFDCDHSTIQIINGKDILCCTHLNSKIYSDHQAQREIMIEQLIREICTVEKDLESENTIIVGDFNINPYDLSCLDARYFHSLPIYEETKRRTRKVAGNEYAMFYNPMWRFLGDIEQPYGTYYHNNSGSINTYWNLYDQVIIRPALRERFIDDSLKIITETHSKYLLDSKGHPNKTISDHLPIIFEIQEDF
ncbi:MAG: endonuclease/exonuclease/phosphatase [Clostridia bacterium]|nr:endonuclease/exonuclease/phosphatase [Clostridia bacterium]